MNSNSDVLKPFGQNIENSSKFFRAADTPKHFERPNLAARVYDPFANTMMKGLMENSEQHSVTRCPEIAGKLKFQVGGNPHQHILLFLQVR